MDQDGDYRYLLFLMNAKLLSSQTIVRYLGIQLSAPPASFLVDEHLVSDSQVPEFVYSIPVLYQMWPLELGSFLLLRLHKG